MLAAVIVLYFVSMIVVYSASDGSSSAMLRHVCHVVLSLAALLACSQISLDTYYRWAPFVYLFSVFLLVLVLLLDNYVKGSRRWLDLGFVGLQPSEMVKLALPIIVCRLIAASEPRLGVKSLLACMLLISAPVLLILRQPDLGTAIMVGVSGLVIFFAAGLAWKYITAFLLAGLACIPVAWSFLFWYQKQRIISFLDPERDPLNAGYNVIQSKIAIGSGGMYGKGWTNGTQSHLDFLPESTTDFIFSVYCEEFGFIGFLLLISMYMLLIFRGIFIAFSSQYLYSRLLCLSLVFSLFAYSYVNMSMTVGQLPVVGIPLPLISMGGTSMLSMSMLIGIVIAIRNQSNLSIYERYA